jgi:hypothetical protein
MRFPLALRNFRAYDVHPGQASVEETVREAAPGRFGASAATVAPYPRDEGGKELRHDSWTIQD